MGKNGMEILKKSIDGECLLPSDSGYEDARRIFNAMIDRRPAAIVRSSGTKDVVAAVQFARENDLPVSIRGAGHNVAGNAVCDDGIMIDMSLRKGIRVDAVSLTARAEPGLNLGDFDRATTAQGLVTTMGVVSKTGIAGLTLGGGLGWLMGKYGLACDNLIEAEVVTAEGKVVRANADENPDLLWGLRGGGGNFGIVTEFVYQLHVLEPMIGGLILHPLEHAKDVLQFYRETTPTLPDELVMVAAILVAPDGNPVSGLAVGYNGDPSAAEKALAPIRKFGKPLADMIQEVPYVQHQSMLDDAYPSGLFHYWKAGFMEKIADESIDIMIEKFKSRPSPLSHLLIEHMHGAAARVSPTDTAFAHRLNHYNFGALTIWPEARETESNMKWLQQFWQEMQPYHSGRAYVNYLSQEGADRVREAYGQNYDRLANLKKKYDPTNFFRFNQNIPPS